MQDNRPLSEQELQRKGRKVFVLMLIFFLVPVIVVIMMYRLNWVPHGTSIGELVTPARLLTDTTELQDHEAKALSPQFWKDKWSIVLIAADCQKTCLDKLHDMRQLHASLYKDMDRAQRVLITTTQDTSTIKADYPDLIIINQPTVSVTKLSQQFNIGQEEATIGNRLYVVDPLGHLMMSYKPSVPLTDVRKDISRLLRYSWAG